MKLGNNNYINEKFIDYIIGQEDDLNSGKITNFKINFNKESHSIKSNDFDLEKFFGVPGIRLIPTIKEESEINLKLEDSSIIYFEYEKNIKYFLNKENIIFIKTFNNTIIKIQMVEETLWFSTNPINFKQHFLNKLT